ncbi:hypothetical protein TTHERM_00801270 (macronuclear) [Tetrahymena thermophila SB210]|uniref:Uncharacterized protein n=1 Tax=Tetrahymena thermophila (strain SB210) TaxID=312017 RepID=Q235H4_TETTS|nr:hypothetical protein TTHERM_00801270 [Tetrahymena thermophila SB210]EAR92129.2 hypothetical protein TTHERM_00801270 [Tetrahymena thermophila SB210]|eukprot:XP_001012374.2 hypothetical protein TTHERM_00801270 [Tetrahymena thermophila SB210]
MYLDAQIRLNYHRLKEKKIIKCFKAILLRDCLINRIFKSILKRYLLYFYLLTFHTEVNSFKKFNNFQLLRLWLQDFIQKKKKNIQASLIQSLKTQENFYKDFSPQSSSLRKTLLNNRSPKNFLQTQNLTQSCFKENSPLRFSINNNQKETFQIRDIKSSNMNFTQLNSLNTKKLEQKISQKLIQMQKLDFESQISESYSEFDRQDSIKNQDLYYLKVKSNNFIYLKFIKTQNYFN